MASFAFEAGIDTATLRAFCPLRMRVSISAIGSVILMFCLRLPTGFCQAGNFAIHGGFTQLVSTQAELAIHTVWATRNCTTCSLAYRAAVTRQLVELRLCNSTFFVRA